MNNPNCDSGAVGDVASRRLFYEGRCQNLFTNEHGRIEIMVQLDEDLPKLEVLASSKGHLGKPSSKPGAAFETKHGTYDSRTSQVRATQNWSRDSIKARQVDLDELQAISHVS